MDARTLLRSPSDPYDLEPSTEVVVTRYVGPYHREPDFGMALVGMWAGAATYIASLSSVFFVLFLFAGSSSIGELLVGTLLTVTFIGVGTMVVVAAVVTPIGVVALFLSSLVFRTLRTNAKWPTIAAFAGALTGFVCTSPVFAADPIDLDWYVLAILIGPGAATVFGQVGAAWISIGPRVSRTRPVASDSAEQDHQAVRFDIRQLMAATAWIAVILTLLKVSGLLTGTVLSIISAWLLFQAVSLVVVLRVVRHIRGHGD